jgi:adenylylsulfate kinase-like enzyme
LVRALHAEAQSPFFEVHVNTPLEICEQRDPKGLYKKARAGQLKNFTGIDDPYEPPLQPELRLNAAMVSPEQAAAGLLIFLEQKGIIPPVHAGNSVLAAAA